MADPRHFDSHAEVYDRARPPYPAALWARLRDQGLLDPGARVLELGTGTGQATGPLLEAGARVTAVEPGPALAGDPAGHRAGPRLFTTFSNWDAAEVAKVARAADDLGGRVAEHYVTPLVVLDRFPAV